VMILQVNALLETLELKYSAQRKGHFTLYNWLVLGHTKCNGVQRVYCNQFPAKPLYGPNYGSHLLDLVMVLKIVPSWSRQIQFGTHGSCSFSLPLHKPTPGPNHLTVLSRRRWKHMTILMMVIIEIIVNIVIMEVIKIMEVIDIIAFI
jgi:hypothetical protein